MVFNWETFSLRADKALYYLARSEYQKRRQLERTRLRSRSRRRRSDALGTLATEEYRRRNQRAWVSWGAKREYVEPATALDILAEAEYLRRKRQQWGNYYPLYGVGQSAWGYIAVDVAFTAEARPEDALDALARREWRERQLRAYDDLMKRYTWYGRT